MQNQIPKIDAATLEPVSVARGSGPGMVPPGPRRSLSRLGRQRLAGPLARRRHQIRVCFQFRQSRRHSRSGDSGYFAKSGAPFLMEVTRRTAADRKGGHLALRQSDGRLLLREVAQCPDADAEAFQDIDRHRYFNTNSLWLRLDLLKEQLAADSGVLPLPMIRNNKTADPAIKNPPPSSSWKSPWARPSSASRRRRHRRAAQPLRPGEDHRRLARAAL